MAGSDKVSHSRRAPPSLGNNHLRGCEAGGDCCAWCGHGTGRRLRRTGKSAPVLAPATRAGGRYDNKPKRRLFEMLKSQGMQMNQAVTFLSDGGDTVRDLQMYLNQRPSIFCTGSIFR